MITMGMTPWRAGPRDCEWQLLLNKQACAASSPGAETILQLDLMNRIMRLSVP
jgi:hypothetical protein